MFHEMDRILQNSVTKGQGYPPYNIAQLNENEYMIPIAVAGFGMDNPQLKRTKIHLKLKELFQKETRM